MSHEIILRHTKQFFFGAEDQDYKLQRNDFRWLGEDEQVLAHQTLKNSKKNFQELSISLCLIVQYLWYLLGLKKAYRYQLIRKHEKSGLPDAFRMKTSALRRVHPSKVQNYPQGHYYFTRIKWNIKWPRTRRSYNSFQYAARHRAVVPVTVQCIKTENTCSYSSQHSDNIKETPTI